METTDRPFVQGAGLFKELPPLDGVLSTDAVSRACAADDFGHIVHQWPLAVLKPGSVEDIVKVVRFARTAGLKVTARGQGHATYGQSQVPGGVVIDMSNLSTIHAISAEYADVDAGVLWSTLLQATLEQGRTPPVLTDYLDLSVGGTLSVGGIGGTSHRYGMQVDQVLEVQVVTGTGTIERCSRQHQRELFDAVLSGLGQCGIVVRAKIRVIPAETHARVFLLFYRDLATFTHDQRILIADERFHYVEGQVRADPAGGWYYMLEAASFYTPPAMPDDLRLLTGLSYDPDITQIEDKTYFDFANRLAPKVAFFTSIGEWNFPHPWFDVFVPGTAVEQYVGEIVATLTLADTGGWPVLLYPVKTERFTMPLARVPAEPVVFLFNILRTAPPDPQAVAALVARNRQLYEHNRDLGGYRYPIGAIPCSQADWQQHFGPVWETLVRAKRHYDPDTLFTPGQGIF